MQSMDWYSTAHLFVAAIRVLTYLKNVPPSVESVCKTLSISDERGHHTCRKLADMEIIEVIEGAYGTKLFITNHLAIEGIPRGEAASKLDEALKKFQVEKKNLSKKVESIQASQKEKQKKLFADLEKQFKKNTK